MTSLPVSRMSCDDYFDAVIDFALAAADAGESHGRQVAGQCVRFSFGTALLESTLFPAVSHLSPMVADVDSLHAISFHGTPELILSDRAPWPLAQHWRTGEILSIRCNRGFVKADSQSGVVSIYDRQSQVAGLWTPAVERLSFWVQCAPMLSILNWWLADRNVSVCHAAAIGSERGAVLLTGPSGAGKSTTAMAAIESNMGYLGDDYVAVTDDERTFIHSLYNCAKLEPTQFRSNFASLSGRVRCIDEVNNEKEMVLVSETHPRQLLQSAPAEAILVPRIADAPKPLIVPISPAAAFKALAPTTVLQLHGNSREKFQLLSQLVQRLPAYELQLSRDLQQNSQCIAEFLGAASGDK